ncbi:MAG: bifunctional molybdenum cofactor biosynthesis protein MoaC/MoaB [Synergistaceae bacterium]|nr:bifunctional molybdenum cofactor biosynthesis protein MoaC/MoaB [Synergistaceae bacterium]
MSDVSAKRVTCREALAEGFVNLTDEIAEAVAGGAPKGDALKTAELAGIMAAKRAPDLIPLCHPIRLDNVRVECSLDAGNKKVKIRAFVKADGVTGVEMEALTAVSVAALTIYDMCKGIDKGMSIEGVRLLRKSGGKSGDYSAGLEEEIKEELLALPRGIRAAVLTVSDKGAGGERADTAGPALRGLLEAAGAEVVHTLVVPDEIDLISEMISRWSGDSHLILTTGGTGLSARDVTPEALTGVADRIVPGLGELMRGESLKHTPNAPLSRCLAVTRGRCLIVALPGSECGARQCFESIKPALRHALEVLGGQGDDCGA